MIRVVIAGGGPAGLAAALALTERGIGCAVVDANGFDHTERAELLPHGAAAIVERLGLSAVLDRAVRLDDVVSRWGNARLQSHGAHPGLGLHGWGVNRAELAVAMRQRAAALGAATRHARIVAADDMGGHWRVRMRGANGTDTLHANFVIDATGRPAHIARRHGATALHDTELVAVTWRIPTHLSATMTAEATADGWWYHVPHSAGGTVGFMTSAARAHEIATDPDTFLSEAARQPTLVPVAGAEGPPHRMDSRNAVLDRICGHGWLAVGDAAAAFDPIASQGLFNALSAGFFAGQAAADAVMGDTDAPGVYAALAARTAERTHAMTHLQYAALPYDTPFWRDRAAATPAPLVPA